MVSLFCLLEYRPKKIAVDLFFTITWKKYKQSWLYFSVEKARFACGTSFLLSVLYEIRTDRGCLPSEIRPP